MKLSITLNEQTYRVDSRVLDISIPLYFDGPQPNIYGVPKATAEAFEGGGLVGDVRRGGSCNFEEYRLIPHCNGTHTECVGHLTGERINVHEELRDRLIPATLITVTPVQAIHTRENYDPPLGNRDRVITAGMIAAEVGRIIPPLCEALIIRTLPNERKKMARDYMAQPPAFFTLEAMNAIRDLGVQHLLVDIPSVDRLFDEGKLSAHHIFWDMAPGITELREDQQVRGRTITEMIYVPEDVENGIYLLDLQIAPFMSDAAPSRPGLFRLES